MDATNTVETLELLLRTAEELGYSVRHECLGGSSGASCMIGGRKVLFVDLSLNPIEQLDQIAAALREDAVIYAMDLPAVVQTALDIRRAA